MYQSAANMRLKVVCICCVCACASNINCNHDLERQGLLYNEGCVRDVID